MSGHPLTIEAIGNQFGLSLPAPPGKCKCPIREHHRKDRTFRIYRANGSSDELFKCWSCDAPNNTGDAVALFALLAGCERREAWFKLRDLGFAVPGQRDEPGAAPRRPSRVLAPKRVPMLGVRPKRILPLDEALWAGWRDTRRGLVERFAEMRGLPGELLRQLDVVDMPDGRSVGFTYRDTGLGKPCRVKCRTVDKKSFYVEPRASPTEPNRKALAPLYLAHRLKPFRVSSVEIVVIVEGEVDALTLVAAGIPNVVSLPDGSESATTVDVGPLYPQFSVWLLSMDSDEPGEKAFRALRDRAQACGADAVRVTWTKMTGEELVVYKDANEALLRGRFTREDFVKSLRVAMEQRLGFAPQIGAA